MTVPDPTCRALDSPASPLSVQLLGALTIQSMPISSSVIMTELNNVQSLMAQLGPALAAIRPVLTIIDTVIALKDVVESIPGLMVGDFESFLDALNRVAKGVSVLIGMTPQLSIPVMVRDTINVLVSALTVIEAVVDQVIGTQQDAQDILTAAASAPANIKTKMEADAACLQSQADKQLEHAIVALGPVGNLIGICQALLDMIPGLPELPTLDDLTGQSATQVKAAISTLRSLLQAVSL